MQFDTRSLWIYLHFPQLQLDLIESTNIQAQLKLKCPSEASHSIPKAVVNTSTNCLCQINQAALEKGIKLNAGLANASLLCSDLQLFEYDPEVESQHIVNIANYLYLFTSDIALIPPNAIALRVQNMLDLYGGLASYWQVIAQALAKQEVKYFAASAYSVQNAKLLALNKRSLITENRKHITSALQKCQLCLSDIDKKDLQKLARIGVQTFDELLRLPINDIANRVSRFSMGIVNEMQGKQASKIGFYQPTPTYHDYMELLYEISISEKLLPVIRLSLRKLASFLLLRNAHCLSLKMKFIQRDHPPLQQEFTSIRPLYKCEDWLDIVQLKLEKIRFESPVYALALECKKYEVAEIANDDMFAHKSSHVEALTLLSRLKSKLGDEQVSRLSFVSEYRPERATEFISIENKCKENTHSCLIFADRPGLLLPHPEPLTIELEVIKGPERIQTGWWDDHDINRDYYIAQGSNGQQLWIFRTPNKEWFLHGFFI